MQAESEGSVSRAGSEAHRGRERRGILTLLPRGGTLPEDAWRQRHRGIVLLLWLHVVVLGMLALQLFGPAPHTLAEVGLVAGPAAFATWRTPGRRVRSAMASFGLVGASALLVHVTGGYVEMHFHYFVVLAIIALYQDWVPFLLALAYVVVEHGVIGVLDPMAVYNHPDAWANPWKWAFIHGGFVLAASAANLVHWRVNETAQEVRAANERETAARAQTEVADRRIRSILVGIDVPFFAADLAWRLTYANPAAFALARTLRFGQPDEPRVGEPLWAWLPGLEHTEIGDVFRQAAESGEPVSRDVQLAQTGAWFAVHAYPLGDGLAVYLRDVTERVLAQHVRERLLHEIGQERSTLRAVMASMSDGLLVAEANGVVRFGNANAARLLRMSTDGLQGAATGTLLDGLAPDLDQPVAVHEAWAAALEHVDAHPHLVLEVAGPPRLDLQVEVFPVTRSADHPDVVGVLLRDITQEREIARLKDELVSMVSHELRTPLATVVGFTELLLARDFPEPRRREYLQAMAREGRRLTNLINDFLDLQRIENGHFEMTCLPTELAPVVAQAIEALGEDPARPIQLEVPDDLPLLLVDPARLQQILLNLLGNARKYSPDGGEIRLIAATNGQEVAVSVADQGLGIPAEAQAHLFERFFRIDRSDRRRIKGTGLGLSITRQLVEAHGGRIWAESAGEGNGSTFHFTLPVAVASVQEGEVLIVEDDPTFARLLARELAGRGCQATPVSSAEAALTQLADGGHRALVVDLMLPGMDGETLLRRVRGRGSHVPVIVVTQMEVGDGERDRLRELGVMELFEKRPGVARAVGDAVERLLVPV